MLHPLKSRPLKFLPTCGLLGHAADAVAAIATVPNPSAIAHAVDRLGRAAKFLSVDVAEIAFVFI
jgi:hypothetical protein